MSGDMETIVGEPHKAVIRSRYTEHDGHAWDSVDHEVAWPERTKRIHRESKRIDPALRPQKDQVLRNAHGIIKSKVETGVIIPRSTHEG